MQAAIASGAVQAHKLNISVDGCNVPLNATINAPYRDESDVFPLYRLSFMWINPIGIASVLIVGSLVSYFTGPRDLKTIDPQLISPVIHRFLPRECFDAYEFKSDMLSEPGTLPLKMSNDDVTDPINVMHMSWSILTFNAWNDENRSAIFMHSHQ